MAVQEAEPAPARSHAELAAIRLALRRRAHRKVTRAGRVNTLRILGLSHDQARERMGLPVEQYHRAKRWLLAAANEAEIGGALLTIDQALNEYADRHVEGCLRVGMLREAGHGRAEIQARLGVSDLEYEIAWEWYRDALAGHGADE